MERESFRRKRKSNVSFQPSDNATISRRVLVKVLAGSAASAGFEVDKALAQSSPALVAPDKDPELVNDIKKLDVVNVNDFGAKADGKTNDAPAFNRAIQYILDNQCTVGGYKGCHKLLIPTGLYAIQESIDLTQVRCINFVIDGSGSILIATCSGEPVIDALGSRWLTIRDLTIIGDKERAPKLGIQIGLIKNGVVADNHRFENVKVLGHFQLACLVNVGGETTGFDHIMLWNRFRDPKSYCLIQDGLNHFGTASKFHPTQVVNTNQNVSFNENEFINCDFRHSGGGVPVWLGDTARHCFIRCYAAAQGDAAFVIYCGDNSHTMLDIDCHCETRKLKSVFLFAGTRINPTIQGFNYRDHSSFAYELILSAAPNLKTIRLQDAEFRIGRYTNQMCKFLDELHRWIVTGLYSSRAPNGWNGDSSFVGELRLGDDIKYCGNIGLKVANGVGRERPAALGEHDTGRLYFDRSLNKIVIWSGNYWLDTNGSRV